MREKRVAAVLRALAPLHPRPIFTAVDAPGALPPDALLATWRRLAPASAAEVADDPAAALDRAGTARSGDQPVVVAGSLYLVGAVRGILCPEDDTA
jgi:dihydrofolate synthase/folylpolyglutamate synthase